MSTKLLWIAGWKPWHPATCAIVLDFIIMPLSTVHGDFHDFLSFTPWQQFPSNLFLLVRKGIKVPTWLACQCQSRFCSQTASLFELMKTLSAVSTVGFSALRGHSPWQEEDGPIPLPRMCHWRAPFLKIWTGIAFSHAFQVSWGWDGGGVFSDIIT